MTAFVLLGDVMVDVTAAITEPMHHASDTEARISVQAGGSAANTAAWLAYLGQSACFIGCVGVDHFGTLVAEYLRHCGVAADLSRKPGQATGTCVVIVDAAGERTMLPDGGANAALTIDDLSAERFRPDAHLHVSGYTLLRPSTRPVALAALARAKDIGMGTSLDAASAAPLARETDAYDQAFPLVDLLLANADEAVVLTGRTDPADGCRALAERVPVAVVKLGADGAVAACADAWIAVPAIPSSDVPCAEPTGPALDTTGAGDAFAAGLLTARAQGATLDECLRSGTRAAAIAVGRVGAGPPPR